MTSISKEEIIKLARISRIEIDDSEIESVIAQVEAVLAYAARIQEVIGDPVEPFASAINVTRADTVITFNAQSILKEAPQVEADYFVVPAILEQE